MPIGIRPADDDRARVAVVAEQAPEHLPERRHQETVVDLLAEHRGEHARIHLRFGERKVAADGVEEPRIGAMHLERARLALRRQRADLFVEAAEHVDFDIEQHD